MSNMIKTDFPIASLLFVLGVGLLTVHPLLWLTHTWMDPTYASQGGWVFILVSGLFVWSVTSPSTGISVVNSRRAWWLLAVTAAVRLISQLLGVNIIGAIALVIDLYAFGLLCGLQQRQRALSPGWLALMFALSLPLERVVQRTLGYGLQHISATGACEVLKLGADAVACEGVRILLAGQDVLVDLPCSGARGLLLLFLLFTALAALARPSWRHAGFGVAILLLSAVASNVLRIVALAIGLAYPHLLGGIHVMDAPWHDLIGICALMLGALPVILWGIRTPNHHPRPTLAQPATTISWAGCSRWSTVFTSLSFVLIALVIVSLPAHPVDVARQIQPPRLPSYLVGFPGTPAELSVLEQQYFTRYGGGAARASYGPYSLLAVRTSAPLRHLHAPDECLAGAGHRVQYLGLSYQPIPAAIYRSAAPDGRQWLITVTFISNSGELATSVAEAVWRWLKNPAGDWIMVQRIAPWKTSATALRDWELAVARALDLTPSENF